MPFIVSGASIQGGRRELGVPTSHADLLPTLLGLAGIDPAEALGRVADGHHDSPPAGGARPLAHNSGCGR